MAKTTALKGLLAGCLLLLVEVGPAMAAAPTVEQMLTYNPRVKGIQISTPAPTEYATCTVKLTTGQQGGSSGWILYDPQGKPLRRFFASNGKNLDTWSYYKDGIEVYREIDSNINGRPDQFRWLNTAGMKWGVSTQENDVIDAWQMISAEEVGQEVFAALTTNDLARLQALFITEAEMRTMKLPAAEAQRMLALQKGIADKLQAIRAKMPQLDAKARFVRVESATPNCSPADANGSGVDQLRYPSRTILFETGDKEKTHDWVQVGEMIKVGFSWRLVDGPSAAIPSTDTTPNNNNLALRKLYDDLTALDDPKTMPPALTQPKMDKAVQDYNMNRVAIIEKIIEQVKGTEQETWTKQVFDNLSAAYQAGNEQAMIKLTERRDRIVNSMPGSDLAAYGVYRHLWASYAAKLIGPIAPTAQQDYLNQLEKFVQTYPKADDAPDALWQLGMGSEYSGKDEEAKRWYQLIYRNFPTHAFAAKARGSEARLNLIGQPLQLSGPQLGTNATFDIASLKGKVVVVYYWTSTVGVCERDFDTLKRLRSAHGKDMELVCVSLDDSAAAASQFLQKAQVAGIHLFQNGGMNSPFAINYGINGLPHLFLVGIDGKVLNRTLQVADLEVELRKALPK